MVSENNPTTAAELTNAEFKNLQDFIYHKSGMFFPLSRKHYIQQKVLKRIQTLRCSSFKDYLHILHKELIRSEIIHMFNEITVNETFFFQGPPAIGSPGEPYLSGSIGARQEDYQYIKRGMFFR